MKKMAWEERARARLASDEPERCRTAHGITAFFPAYNDAPTIGGLVAFTDAVLSRVTPNYEILVVNDASPDDGRGDPEVERLMSSHKSRRPH